MSGIFVFWRNKFFMVRKFNFKIKLGIITKDFPIKKEFHGNSL